MNSTTNESSLDRGVRALEWDRLGLGAGLAYAYSHSFTKPYLLFSS